jgi:repressor LexA
MPARTPITEKEIEQKELTVLRYIHAYITEHYYPPSMSEIANAIPAKNGNPASASVVARYMRKLQDLGYITTEPRVARSTRVTDRGAYKLLTEQRKV